MLLVVTLSNCNCSHKLKMAYKKVILELPLFICVELKVRITVLCECELVGINTLITTDTMFTNEHVGNVTILENSTN